MGAKSAFAESPNLPLNRNRCFTNSGSAFQNGLNLCQNVVQTERPPKLKLKELGGFPTVS